MNPSKMNSKLFGLLLLLVVPNVITARSLRANHHHLSENHISSLDNSYDEDYEENLALAVDVDLSVEEIENNEKNKIREVENKAKMEIEELENKEKMELDALANDEYVADEYVPVLTPVFAPVPTNPPVGWFYAETFSNYPSATSRPSPQPSTMQDPTNALTDTNYIRIRNFFSGRRLYAQADQEFEAGFGGIATGRIWNDQKWQLRQVECGAGECAPDEGQNCFWIENKHSGRRIYAQGRGKNMENGVGAVLSNYETYQDQKWMIEEVDCDSDETCYIIKNINSCRRLYAEGGRNWEAGVGAYNGHTVKPDQKWIFDSD